MGLISPHTTSRHFGIRTFSFEIENFSVLTTIAAPSLRLAPGLGGANIFYTLQFKQFFKFKLMFLIFRFVPNLSLNEREQFLFSILMPKFSTFGSKDLTL